MSAKTHSFLVVLKENIGEEQSKVMVQLFKNLANVADVTAITADYSTAIGESREKNRIKDKLIEFYNQL